MLPLLEQEGHWAEALVVHSLLAEDAAGEHGAVRNLAPGRPASRYLSGIPEASRGYCQGPLLGILDRNTSGTSHYGNRYRRVVRGADLRGNVAHGRVDCSRQCAADGRAAEGLSCECVQLPTGKHLVTSSSNEYPADDRWHHDNPLIH